jgi:serine protease
MKAAARNDKHHNLVAERRVLMKWLGNFSDLITRRQRAMSGQSKAVNPFGWFSSPWARLSVILIAIASLSMSAWWPRASEPASTLRAQPPADVYRVVQGAQPPVPLAASEVEVIVNLADDRDDLEATLEARYGFDLRLNSAYADEENLFLVRVPSADADALIARLSAEDGIDHAEVNGQMEGLGFVPNDPLYMFQWNLDQVNAEDAWSLSTGDGVVVAVIDTGVAYQDDNSRLRKRGVQMPDLKQTRVVGGYDFVDDDTAPYDQQGHGTHVAGTIAQSTDNGYGVAGLAFNAKIMPIRVLDGEGRGSFSDVADGIRFAADNGAQVINLSLGGFFPSAEVKAAVQHAHNKGVVVVAAAGNSGSRAKSYPAAFDQVIAVAATQYDRQPTFYSNFGSYVDIAAPGGNTLVDQDGDGKPDGIMQETLKRGPDGRALMEPAFALYMGTSMAAPHVAAAAALLVAQGVSNPAEVERLLVETAKTDKGWDKDYGRGILDVSAATQRHATEGGLWRSGAAALLALVSLLTLRRRRQLTLGERPHASVSFWFGWALGAGALFALPTWLGVGGWVGALAAQPLTAWGSALIGPGAWSPLAASALPMIGAAALLLGTRRGRYWAAGFGIATAATLAVAAAFPTADIAWLPGVAGGLDRAWLAVNALLCAWMGHSALRRA